MNEGVKILMDSMSEAAATTKQEIGFDEAFTLHHRTVFRCARAVVNDSALAEDITQEVFLKLYYHLESIKTDEMLRPWLIRVTINLSRNAIRGNIRANVREESYVKETEEYEALKEGEVRRNVPNADGFALLEPINLNKFFNKFVAENYKK